MCRTSKCPTYFYFQTYQDYDPNSADPLIKGNSSRSDAYGAFTCFMNTSSTSTNFTACDRVVTNPYGTVYRYRYLTDLCIMCDVSCARCYGPTNLTCK